MPNAGSCPIADGHPQVHDRAEAQLAALPDLVLTYVMLPDSDGPSLASRLRAFSARPTVVTTPANSDGADKRRARRRQQLLRKPFGPEQLADAVARLIHPRAAPCAADGAH